MPKRTWSDANAHSPKSSSSPFQYPPAISPSQSYEAEAVPIAPKRAHIADGVAAKSSGESPARGRNGSANGNAADERRMPTISRKVKACAACRKQKIRCIMAGEPPCQRCKERGLSCRLNKSLQTLMSEDSRWKSSVTKDIGNIYLSLEKVLQSLSLPPLPPARVMSEESVMFFDQDDQDNEHDDDDPSYDNSPKVSPLNENLSHVPIESLYQITGMRALRAHEPGPEEQERICKQLRDTDFISKGLVSVEDAEYLTSFYLTRLDPYVWSLAGAYSNLESFRRKSPTLTACVLTVGALHDTAKAHLYSVCLKEYQRLVANAMFERRIDMEYLRALVIGSYWLSEIAFTLSGYAIRRASEFYLSQCYDQIVDAIKYPDKYENQQLQKAMDGLRLLYLLYICDHHLSILYGRPSIMRDNERWIIGCEAYLASSLATDSDKRIASQVSLVLIMNQIRESFGPEETTSALPASAAAKIAVFERDLANWQARYSYHNPHKLIGDWPSKGVSIHQLFSRLYLDAYVFRGLSEANPVIPAHFLETASAAVAAATTIVGSLLEEETLQKSLAGVPHYFHGMVAFACMFLLRVATKHSAQLFPNNSDLGNAIARLAQLFRMTEVGREHLIHKMAEGLEKMVDILGGKSPRSKMRYNGLGVTPNKDQLSNPPDGHVVRRDLVGQPPTYDIDPFDPNSFGFGDPNLGLGMPFFDFEGTNFGLDGPYIQ
jgi:hypothetical protein